MQTVINREKKKITVNFIPEEYKLQFIKHFYAYLSEGENECPCISSFLKGAFFASKRIIMINTDG